MVWYYVKNNQQAGPIEDAAFAELVRNGTVSSDTLVWNDSMSEWAPCSQAYQANRQPAMAVTPDNDCTCQECGRQFPDDQVVPLAGGFVCAACKPLALRKMQEGITAPGTYEYAGFWIRLVAKIIDGFCQKIIVFPLSFVAGIAIGASAAASGGGNSTAVMVMAQFIGGLIGITVSIGYLTFFIGKHGATPGKMAVGIKVIRMDGSRLTYGQAFGRAWAEWLCYATCGIGYVIAAFDDEKRGLHDHVCNTRVVYK